MPHFCATLALAMLPAAALAAPVRVPDGMSFREFYGGFFPTEEWAEALAPLPLAQRGNPFQTVRVADSMPEDPKERWPGAVVLMTREEVESAERDLAPILAVEAAALLGLVPRRNRLSGNARVMLANRAIPCPEGDGGRLTWWPDRPGEIRCSRGHLVEPFEMFPPTGAFHIAGPLGEVQEYPYHDAPDGRRIYLTGEFMDPLRVSTLARAAERMGAMYQLTGDAEYARRAAAILLDFAHALPHWPKISRGQVSGLKGERRFRPLDDFGPYTGLWYDRYHVGVRAEPRHLARAYDFVAAADVWGPLDALAEGGDARAAIDRDLFLYTLRDAVLYDVRHPQPRAALSNYIPYQIEGFLAIGRAAGLPEAVHYAAWKTRMLAQKTLMADGMFPESPSYARQHVYGMARAIRLAEGYSDPPGFASTVDGQRLDALDIASELPELARAVAVLESLVYPSGENMMLHDTYGRLRSAGFPAPAETRPLLYPAWGHAVLGRGHRERGDPIQAHLHYSGNWGHDHLDMLNLVLWAYEDELVSDIGYAHTYRRFANDTVGHNLVAVDRSPQRGGLRSPGDLLAWRAGPDGFQAAEADGRAAYNQCSTYRRALVLLPVGGDNLVLDIFLVEGGDVHEWMAQGSCMVAGDLEVSVPTEFHADSYADDGKPFEPPAHREYLWQRRQQGLHPHRYGPDETYPWYGVFRDVRKGRMEGAMLATFTYHAEGYPRLNAHVVQPTDADIYTCTVPSLRRCWNPATRREEHSSVEKYRMPKLIIRRDGENLFSRFVVLWEPTRGHTVVESVRDLAPGDPDGVALEVRTTPEAGGRRIRAYWAADPEKPFRAQDGALLQGRYAVATEAGGGLRVELFEAGRFRDESVEVSVTQRPALPLVGVLEKGEGHALELDGAWPDVAEGEPRVFAEPVHAVLSQNRGDRRAFPIVGVETRGGRTLLRAERHPGFKYDRETSTLTEEFTPFNEIAGEARVKLFSCVTLERAAADAPWRVRTTDPLTVNGRPVERRGH